MSQRYKVIILPRAEAEVEEIYQWIYGQSAEIAFEWHLGLLDAIESLKSFPRRCPLVPESLLFEEELRHLLYGRKGKQHRLIFTIRDDTVYLYSVRHSARDALRPDTDTPESAEDQN